MEFLADHPQIEIIRYATVLAVSFPICLAQRQLVGNQSHLFGFLSTSLIVLIVFSWNAYLHLLTSALFIYLFSTLLNPLLLFTAIFTHLSFLQAKFQLFPSTDFIDFSSLIMVMTIKLTSFAYCAFDGRMKVYPDEYSKSHAIHHYPTLLEFLGFAFNPSGFYVGPALDFTTYRNYTQRKGAYETLIPAGSRALHLLITAIVMLTIQLGLQDYLHFIHCSSPWFLNLPFIYKVGYIMASGIVVRAKFHCVWKLSESSCLLSGIGIGVVDGKVVDSLAENVDIMGVEFGQSPKQLLDSWNKFTAVWLRRYIYTRIPIQSLKLPSTFLVSAFWHGFHSGYYTSFLSTVFLTAVGRIMRRNFHPIKQKIPMYNLLGWISSLFLTNYLIVSFMLKDLYSSWLCWKSMYFVGHFVMAFIIGMDYLFGSSHSMKRRSSSEGKEK